ncbi:MAG: hypothetical protein ACXU88_10800, partial [Myxococcaceae bacterium]
MSAARGASVQNRARNESRNTTTLARVVSAQGVKRNAERGSTSANSGATEVAIAHTHQRRHSGGQQSAK